MRSSIPPPTRRTQRRRIALLLAGIAATLAVVLLVLRYEPPQIGRRLFGGLRSSDFMLALSLAGVSGLLLLWCVARVAAQRAALAILSTGIAWFGAEVLHVGLYNPASADDALGRHRMPRANVHGQTPPDIAWAWGLPCEQIPFHFTTNAAGHRNPPDRDSGSVYCLGDSCLVGALLPWPSTVIARLEQALGRPCVNTALIGLAPQEAQAEFLALEPAPDLQGRLVLQFLCEDNDLLDSHRLRQPAAAPARASLWSRTLAERTILALQAWTQPVVAEARRRTGRFGDQDVRFLWRHERGSVVEQEVDVILSSLESFAQQVTGRGGAFGVVLIPAKLRALGPHCTFPPDTDLAPAERDYSPLAGPLAAWSGRTGIAVLDLQGDLSAAAAKGRLTWFADDTHWNATGAEVAADAVAAWAFVRQHLTAQKR